MLFRNICSEYVYRENIKALRAPSSFFYDWAGQLLAAVSCLPSFLLLLCLGRARSSRPGRPWPKIR